MDEDLITSELSDLKMDEDRRILYEFWESLPPLKFIDVRKNIYGKQPIRRAIVRILREGLVDKAEDESTKRRRALNVYEIELKLKEYFKNNKDKEDKVTVTRTKLYFHLNLLEEAGMINVVTTLLEGPYKRNKTKYYGRTARALFITDQEMSLDEYKRRFTEFEKLAKLLKIPLPPNFSEFPKKMMEIDQKRYRKLAYWLSSHESLMDENEINASDVYEFIKFIDMLKPEHLGILSNIYENFQKELGK